MPLKSTLLVLTLCYFSAQQQGLPGESEIRELQHASNEAIEHQDLKAFAASLDDDFVMIRGNGVLVPSRQAYLDLFAEDFANPKAIRYQRIADKIEISNAAPLAAEHGHWIGVKPDGNRAYAGTYLAMWRRTQAGWKIRSELFVVLECTDGPACSGYRKP